MVLFNFEPHPYRAKPLGSSMSTFCGHTPAGAIHLSSGALERTGPDGQPRLMMVAVVDHHLCGFNMNHRETGDLSLQGGSCMGLVF